MEGKRERPRVARVKNLKEQKDPEMGVEAVADMPALCLLGAMMKGSSRRRTQRATLTPDSNGLLSSQSKLINCCESKTNKTKSKKKKLLLFL